MHPLDRLAHNGQPDARAGILALFMQPLKHSEEPLLDIFFNADAVVLDPKAHPPVEGFSAKDNARNRARLDELDRVVEQVGQALGQRSLVSPHWQEWMLNLDLR